MTSYAVHSEAFLMCQRDVVAGRPSRILAIRGSGEAIFWKMSISDWDNLSVILFLKGIASAALILWQGNG